jgi:hypothetical protein
VRRAAIHGTLHELAGRDRTARRDEQLPFSPRLREAEDMPRDGSPVAGIPAHSCLRTAIGSTERARSAAAYVISAAPLATAAAVPANVAASYGLTP